LKIIKNNDSDMIQYTRPPYPRIDDLIKEAQKLMYDAIWEEDQKQIDRLTAEINSLNQLIKYGETYIIPF